MVTRNWTYAARRRLFIDAPVALLGALFYLGTATAPNGATVLGVFMMLTAALAAALDNDSTPAETGRKRK